MTAEDPAPPPASASAPAEPDAARRLLRDRCEALFREHNDALVRAVYARTHSWEEATEIVQEAYVRIFRLGEPPAINFLRAYLYKTAFNLAADRRNRQTVHDRDQQAVYHEIYHDRELDNPSPEQLFMKDEVRTHLQAAVDTLPPKSRLAYTLVELEGHTVTEAAGQMGLNEMAVYQLVRRAYGHLARTLTQRGWCK